MLHFSVLGMLKYILRYYDSLVGQLTIVLPKFSLSACACPSLKRERNFKSSGFLSNTCCPIQLKGSKWKERAKEDRPPGDVLGKHVIDVLGKSFARDVLSENH